MGKISDYVDKVFERMDALRPQETFVIDTKVIPENRQQFIDSVKLYIDHNGTVEFYDDYTKLRRCN